MAISRKLIEKNIRQLERELKKITGILYSTPLSDLVELQIETIETAKKMEAEESLKYLKKQMKKEKELRKLCEKQINSSKLTSKQVEIEFEITELKNYLYYNYTRHE